MSATQVDYARIVLLNRTIRELTAANPVLLSGEAAIADVGTTRPDLRFGDGVRPWSALPSFLATGIGGGIFAPFEIQNTINGHPLFRINDQIVAPGDSVASFGPGEAGGTGYSILTVAGNNDGTPFRVWAAHNDRPGSWVAAFHGEGWEPGDPNRLPGYTGPTPGTSNGVVIAAGTNANDMALLVENDARGGLEDYKKFLVIRGDGSGFIGPDEAHALYWDAAGNFNVRGTASLPGRTMSELADVSISGLRLGDVLQWNGSMWGNVSHLAGYVTLINTGVGLRGGPITETGTIALEDTMVRAGHYTNADIVVDQQGRITWAQNGSNELAGLSDVELTDPAEGQALTWDGTHWTNSTPANALEDLTDVDLVDKVQGEVLSWNEQTQRWTNSPLPGGSVIALETLQDVDITDPQPGQALTWDGSNWVNTKGAAVFVDTTPPADPESGWLWWDAVSGQLFVWYDDGTSAQWVIANSEGGLGGGGGGGTDGGGGGGASELAQLTDVTITNPAAGQQLSYSGTSWVNKPAGQGLTVPIACAIASLATAPTILIPITIPLTIPANLAGSQAGCTVGPTNNISIMVSRRYLSGGNWSTHNVGGFNFGPGMLAPAGSPGTGASFAPGDQLMITTQNGGGSGSDPTMANIGVTIQATRA